MNVFSHTEVQENSKGSGQALLRETIFVFSLTYLFNIEIIFRNYVSGCITNIPPKKWIVIPNKGKNEPSVQGNLQKKSLHPNTYNTNPSKIFSMVFRIFYNSRN